MIKFDQAVVDFGTVSNTGASTADSANSIIIDFNVVIIDAFQTSGTNIWVTAGAEYYNGDEIWIGQTALPFTTTTPFATLSTVIKI